MDLKQHLLRQIAFSRATFGPGRRTNGVLDHIAKEIEEVRASDGSPREWVDLVILSLDGLWRSIMWQENSIAADPDAVADVVCQTILHKQSKNEGRVWPDWRGMSTEKAIEHVRPVARK
jgi:hypothetical protein